MEEVKDLPQEKSAEQEFLEVALDTLNTDEILVILDNMPPVNILTLCRVSKRFSEICSDQKLFVRLLKKHYPKVEIDKNDPKSQFIQLAGESGIYYIVFYEPFQDKTDNYGTEMVILGEYEDTAYRYEKEEELTRTYMDFEIKGTIVLAEGTEIWLMVPFNSMYIGTEAYMTFEDALDDYMEKGFDEVIQYLTADFIETLEDHDPWYDEKLLRLLVSYIYDNVSDDDKDSEWALEYINLFNEYIEIKGLPTPFTEENVKQYISENKFLVTDPDKQDDQTLFVQFVKVKIGGEY